MGDACQDKGKGANVLITKNINPSPISGSRKSGIAHAHSSFIDRSSIARPIRVRGENIPSEHVNYAPGQSPGHRPLASAEFHESLSRIYMYAWQTRMLKPACLPTCSPALPLPRRPILPPCTHHCQCTISSLFIGPAQRSPLIIARGCGERSRRHSQKQRGYCRCGTN